MDTQPPDQTRLIRQALADLIFGIALFAIFILLGVFGAKQAASDTLVFAALPETGHRAAPSHIELPLLVKR